VSLTVTWIDGKREPRCPPDPAYPLGKDVDARSGAGLFCHVDLPYPVERCGYFLVHCAICRQTIAITTIHP